MLKDNSSLTICSSLNWSLRLPSSLPSMGWPGLRTVSLIPSKLAKASTSQSVNLYNPPLDLSPGYAALLFNLEYEVFRMAKQ
jgi:hypothetical protein